VVCAVTGKTCFVFSGVWIITNGMHCGVTKVVGEAVRDYEISRRSQQPKVVIHDKIAGRSQQSKVVTHDEIAGRSQQSNVVTLGFANWGEICYPEREKMSKVRVSHAISCTQCHSVLR